MLRWTCVAVALAATAPVFAQTPADSAQVLLNEGSRAFTQGSVGARNRAIALWTRAVVFIRRVGDRRIEGRTLGNIGFVYDGLGRLDSALAYYRQALAIQRELSDRRAQGETLARIGTVRSALGQPEAALADYRQALIIRREVGDSRGEGATLNDIGTAGEDKAAVGRECEHVPEPRMAGELLDLLARGHGPQPGRAIPAHGRHVAAVGREPNVVDGMEVPLGGDQAQLGVGLLRRADGRKHAERQRDDNTNQSAHLRGSYSAWPVAPPVPILASEEHGRKLTAVSGIRCSP